MIDEEISVIVVTYNNGKYIDRCIKSIINQTYKKIKIIVIDDGSTDGTHIILEKYKYSIKIYTKENGGVASARNLGIKMCTTKYMMFVDADDYLELNAIEIMYKKLIETNSDIVMGNTENTQVEDIVIGKEKYKYLFNREIKYFMVSWNKLMKTELFNNLTYPNIHIAEDDYMIYYILERAKKMTIIGQKTYNYYINLNGLTSKKLEYYKEIIFVFKDRYLFFTGTSYRDIAYRRYMDYYIYLYCQFKDKKIEKSDLIEEFKEELKIKGNVKYLFFYVFPNLYYILFNIRRKICKAKYQ